MNILRKLEKVPLRSIYNNISKLSEISGYEGSVKYKMGLFGYYLIHDFHYEKILEILIYGLSRRGRREVKTLYLGVDIQWKALRDCKRNI